MKPPAHHGHTAKHSSRKHAAHHHPHKGKHGGTSKHHPKGKARKPGAAPVPVGKGPGLGNAGGAVGKPRKLSPGDVALCPAEAVAAAARLAGWAVSDEDVLDLYARCADGPSSGFTIAAALAAASRWGVGGVRLIDHEPLVMAGGAGVLSSPFATLGRADEGHRESVFPVAALPADEHVERSHALILGVESRDEPARRAEGLQICGAAAKADLADVAHAAAFAPAEQPDPFVPAEDGADFLFGHALILGVDLPGPHAVTVATDGCWVSWGEHYDPADFPDAVIEEAWAVAF